MYSKHYATMEQKGTPTTAPATAGVNAPARRAPDTADTNHSNRIPSGISRLLSDLHMSLGIRAPTCTSSAHQDAVSLSAPQSPSGHLSTLRAALAVGRGHWFPPWAITYHMPEMSIRHACLRVALRER